MQLEFHDAFRGVQVCNASRLLVRDGLGNPIAVIIDLNDTGTHYVLSTVNEPTDFNQVIQRLLGSNHQIAVHDVMTPSTQLIKPAGLSSP